VSVDPRIRPRDQSAVNEISFNLNLQSAVRKTAGSEFYNDFCSTYLGVNISLLKLWSLTKRREDIPVMTLSHRLLVASLSITAPTVSPSVDKTCDILRMVSKSQQQLRAELSRTSLTTCSTDTAFHKQPSRHI
jgi:hypothetical protein